LIAAALAQESASTNQPAEAKGWASLNWGMTIQQAQEAMPDLRQLASPRQVQRMMTRLETKGVNLGRVTANADVQFYPEKDYLSAVNMVADDSDAKVRAANFASLKEGLTEKYGTPSGEDQSTSVNASGGICVTKTVLWRLKFSMIRLQSYGYEDVGFVAVRYAERKPDDTL
jgi:hypothetical protein